MPLTLDQILRDSCFLTKPEIHIFAYGSLKLLQLPQYLFILTMHSYKVKMKLHELPSTPKNITFLPVLPPLKWEKIHIYQI